MKRFLIPAGASVALALSVAVLTPSQASAQTYDRSQSYGQQNGSYDQDYRNDNRQNQARRNSNNGATAWGDPWLNENDFDYNRRHWLPNRNQGQDYGRNNENWDRNESRYGGDRDQNRYDNRYRGPNDRSGYGLGGNQYPSQRPDYDDED